MEDGLSMKDMLMSFDLADNGAKYEEYEQHQKKMEQERIHKLYKESGVPNKFFDQSFDTFSTLTEGEQEAKRIAIDFATAPKNKVLMMCGNNGNGKTHLASAIVRYEIENGNKAEYITSPKLCIAYDSATGYKTRMSREEIINHYCSVNVLVIDECCKYFLNTELEKFLLLQIVCGRYENNLPTVLVSNSDKKAFVEFMGKAVYDRLTEVCTTIDFNWESKRKTNREI